MDVLVYRYGWTANWFAVAVCGVLLGRAGGSAVQLWGSGALPPGPPTSVARAASAAGFPRGEAAGIVSRNVFCSACPPLGLEVGPVRAEGPRRCTLPLQLLAVNEIAPGSPAGWAIAVLRDGETRDTGAFAAGDRVKGAMLTAISSTRVLLSNAGVTEYLDLMEEPPTPAAPSTSAERTAPTPAGDRFSQELARGIRKLGERRYELSRATIESVLGNMNMVIGTAQIIPEVREGRAAGFRFGRVRPGGAFDLIGLQPGDVVSAINGLELTSPEKAFDVYARLKSAAHLSLGIERGGQRISYEYDIR